MKGTSLKQAAERRTDVFEIDPRKIVVVEGFNARSEDDPELEDHIKWLMGSIQEVGVLEPLTVRHNPNMNRIELSHGHCRLEAVSRLIGQGHDIKTVPVRNEGRRLSDEERVAQIVLRNDGKPLKPIEVAEVYRRLINFGWTEAQIAARMSRSPSHVNSLLLLISAPEAVKRQVREGRVAATVAIDLIRKHGDGAAAKIEAGEKKAQKAGKEKVTAKHVESGPKRSAKNFKLLWDFVNAVAYGDQAEFDSVERAKELVRDLDSF